MVSTPKLDDASEEGVCNCESYDCDGACCGGKCTCAISEEMWVELNALPTHDERIARVRQIMEQ